MTTLIYNTRKKTIFAVKNYYKCYFFRPENGLIMN